MKVVAIIPSLASEITKPYLRLCVESLRATTDWDIIVVTNGTKTSEPLNIDGITQRLHTRDQGQCNAVNIGVQAANNPDYIFIVNDDMYFSEGWDKNLRFEYPCLSPNLMEPVDNTGSAPPFIKTAGGNDLSAFEPDIVDEEILKITEGGEVAPEPGFNFPVFIKKDLWDHLGGYDVAFDPWGSNGDTDLQTRINLAGVVPMRYTDVLVYHFSNKSGTFDGTHQDFYQHNIEYFREKFGFSRDDVPGCNVWYNTNMIPMDKSKIKLRVKKYEAN